MRKTIWLLLGLVIPASVLAQELTNAPASQPTGTTSAATTQSTSAQRRAATELRTVPLVPGPATVVGRNVNVRGKAGLKGEVIATVTKGDQVTVIEEITLSRSAADEPSAWAKIVLPPTAHVWVNSNFINHSNNTVIPRRLNLRGGPGENYSVLGQLERGDTVRVVKTQDEWVEIEHPTNAYAFMAAQYLEQGPASATTANTTETKTPETKTTEVAATTTPAEEKTPDAPVTPATVSEGPEVKTATNVPEAAKTPDAATSGTTSNASATSTDTWTTTNEVARPTQPEEPLPPRIVQREGVVRGTISIQAPTRYELWSPESGKVINYLYTTAAGLDLSRYKGLRIIVTGEEALDERWRNTPVVTIQKIVVLD